MQFSSFESPFHWELCEICLYNFLHTQFFFINTQKRQTWFYTLLALAHTLTRIHTLHHWWVDALLLLLFCLIVSFLISPHQFRFVAFVAEPFFHSCCLLLSSLVLMFLFIFCLCFAFSNLSVWFSAAAVARD